MIINAWTEGRHLPIVCSACQMSLQQRAIADSAAELLLYNNIIYNTVVSRHLVVICVEPYNFIKIKLKEPTM